MDNQKTYALALLAGSTLTVTYPSPNKDGGDYHAVIPFPQSYQQAVAGALELLGKYMTDTKEDDIILKYSTKDSDGQRIWADFAPINWGAVVHPGDEEAVEVIKDWVKNPPALLPYQSQGSQLRTAERVLGSGKTLNFYRFKSNDNLTNWAPFPSSASIDDAVWKATVPEPLGILGVIAK
ncbi:hypothetical protein B0H17DRAFT_1327521 [Mycena rosella]|uniref:Uncharacterized protein n=1 Tax=Mycena rosella TaxID=1033263 RepID=A0AAD7DX79_MYCRO|nr:hypothetical protein B0H17DRAFT_1327521 [Mycena rosella]